MTWFRARAQCMAAGGDLWKVDKLDDMYQVARYLKTKAFYWVGATDHAWVYDAGGVGKTGALLVAALYLCPLSLSSPRSLGLCLSLPLSVSVCLLSLIHI